MDAQQQWNNYDYYNNEPAAPPQNGFSIALEKNGADDDARPVVRMTELAVRSPAWPADRIVDTHILFSFTTPSSCPVLHTVMT